MGRQSVIYQGARYSIVWETEDQEQYRNFQVLAPSGELLGEFRYEQLRQWGVPWGYSVLPARGKPLPGAIYSCRRSAAKAIIERSGH